MKQFNVAGRKYTKQVNKQEREIIANGRVLHPVYELIGGLRRDLDSTAKIQGAILKREMDNQQRGIDVIVSQLEKSLEGAK